MAGKELGVKFSTPIFDGATLEQITEYTRKAKLPDFDVHISMMGKQEKDLTNQQLLASFI